MLLRYRVVSADDHQRGRCRHRGAGRCIDGIMQPSREVRGRAGRQVVGALQFVAGAAAARAVHPRRRAHGGHASPFPAVPGSIVAVTFGPDGLLWFVGSGGVGKFNTADSSVTVYPLCRTERRRVRYRGWRGRQHLGQQVQRTAIIGQSIVPTGRCRNFRFPTARTGGLCSSAPAATGTSGTPTRLRTRSDASRPRRVCGIRYRQRRPRE